MRKPSKKQGLIAAAVIVVLIVIFVLTRGGDAPEETLAVQTKSVSLISLSASSTASLSHIAASGRIRAAQEATLVSEGSGTVSLVSAAIGKTVSRGEVLVTLSNPDTLAQVAQARAALASAESAVSSSETGYANSRIAAADAIEGTLTTATDILYNKISSLYSEPSKVQGFGVRSRAAQSSTVYHIEAGDAATEDLVRNQTSKAVADVAALNQMISTGVGNDLTSAATAAETALLSLRSLLETISSIINKYPTETAEAESFYGGYRASVSANLATVNGTLTGLRSSMQVYNSALVANEGASAAQARAALEAAEAQLAKTVIRAPFSGKILSVSAQAGEYVTPGTPVVSLIDSSSKEASVFVTGSDAQRISVGSPATAGSVSGSVIEKAPGISQSTGKVEIVVALPDDESLTIGEYVDIEIESGGNGSQKIFSLPLKAIKMTSTGAQVFVVENGTVAARPVEIGSIQGDRVEILAGLEGTDAVVANTRGLSAGESVTIR